MKKEYFNTHTEAIGHISGCNGIDIFGVENEGGQDFIYYTSNAWSGEPRNIQHKSRIYLDKDNNSYFKCNGYRFYLKDTI